MVPLLRMSRAIPLFPLWAVLPVKSLSSCTVELYLYSHYGPYCLYRPQCLYSTAYLYSPHGPYSLYRASVPVQYSYTSTPHMGRTACTGPSASTRMHFTVSTLFSVYSNTKLQQGKVNFERQLIGSNFAKGSYLRPPRGSL